MHQKDNFSLVIKLLPLRCSDCSCSGRVDPSVLPTPHLFPTVHMLHLLSLCCSRNCKQNASFGSCYLCANRLTLAGAAVDAGLCTAFPVCSCGFLPGMAPGLCSSPSWAADGRCAKQPVGSRWEQTATACSSGESAGFLTPGRKSGMTRSAVLLRHVTRRIRTQKPLLLFLWVDKPGFGSL